MSSEDSEAVGLHSSASYDSQPLPENQDSSERPGGLSRTSTFGKKCWICMSDASEDDQKNPPIWRSPCQCSLTAHEDCLLDWVANLESPKTTRRKGSSQILCPQCKSEIKIARPRSYVLDAYRALDRTFARAVLPTVGLSLAGSFWAGLWVHGFTSVYLIFGEVEANRILEASSGHLPWLSAYSLIPVNLVMSRTNYAEFVLPISSLFILSAQLGEGFEIDMTAWPPSPATVFACLPPVRSLYNWCYHQAFCDLNKAWLSEIRPRNQEQVEGQDDNVADAANEDEEGGGRLEIVLEANIPIGEAEGNLDDAAQHHGEEEGEVGDGNQQDGQNGNPHVHRLLADRGDILVQGTSSLGQSVLGALAFPAVAAGMGSLLNFALPSTWLGPVNALNGRPGILRTRWGRSVLGGALFVVLKDALVLYCRWRLAQSHRSRRIMDYDKNTKQYKV